MILELDDLQGVDPKYFAALAGCSVTKLRQGKITQEQFEQARTLIFTLRDEYDISDVNEWIKAPAHADDEELSVTVFSLLKRGLNLEVYLSNPEEALGKVSPSWRVIYRKTPCDLEGWN